MTHDLHNHTENYMFQNIGKRALKFEFSRKKTFKEIQSILFQTKVHFEDHRLFIQ